MNWHKYVKILQLCKSRCDNATPYEYNVMWRKHWKTLGQLFLLLVCYFYYYYNEVTARWLTFPFLPFHRLIFVFLNFLKRKLTFPIFLHPFPFQFIIILTNLAIKKFQWKFLKYLLNNRQESFQWNGKYSKGGSLNFLS